MDIDRKETAMDARSIEDIVRQLEPEHDGRHIAAAVRDAEIARDGAE